LDKIEGGDSKREVMCICFNHPTKKNSLVEAPHGRRPWPVMGSSPERKGKGERGGAWGRGAMGRAAWSSSPPTAACSFCARVILPVREKKKTAGRRREERQEKEKKEKMRKICKHGNFRKIKDNL
jgi:hypothetical protein